MWTERHGTVRMLSSGYSSAGPRPPSSEELFPVHELTHFRLETAHSARGFRLQILIWGTNYAQFRIRLDRDVARVLPKILSKLWVS
jgi:hypothetical protein